MEPIIQHSPPIIPSISQPIATTEATATSPSWWISMATGIAQWSLIESVIYESLLFLHLYAVSCCTSPVVWGAIGTALSGLFLFVYRMHGGLEEVLSTFFSEWHRDRSTFMRVVVSYILSTHAVLITIILSILWYSGIAQIAGGGLFIFIIGITALSECYKKIMRSLLKLLLYNRLLACCEIILMLSYLLLVWSWYVLTSSLGVLSIIIPIFITSSCSAIIYTIVWYQWLSTLPTTNNLQIPVSGTRIFRAMASAYIHQVTNICFSSNFLVPLIAAQQGLIVAGSLKLVTASINGLSKIVDKVMTTTVSTILAHSRIRSAGITWLPIAQQLQCITVVLAIVFGIARYTTNYIFLIACLYSFLMLFDRIAVLFERYFFIYERQWVPLLVNGLATITILFSIKFGLCAPLLAVCFARAFSLIGLIYLCR